MKIFSELIESFDPHNPNFRPTEIYQEGWLVKLVLHQASTLKEDGHSLGFLPGSSWYSESQLPTAFKSRYRGDPLGEARTHADGVIGDIRVGKRAKVDLELAPRARQFTVIEAKINAPLSAGTKNAPYFDQAARNVACMAEVMAKAGVNPASSDRLGFIVLAPQASIRRGTFSREMTVDSIRQKVQQRVTAYDGDLDRWHRSYFEPMLDVIRLETLSWEAVIDWIGSQKSEAAGELGEFYRLCLRYN